MFPKNTREREPSYNFMNDDLYDDIEIQLVSLDQDQIVSEEESDFVLKIHSSPSIAESLQEKLYYLQTNNTDNSEIEHKMDYYDSISNSPMTLSGNSSVRESARESIISEEDVSRPLPPSNKRTTYKKLTFEEIEHSFQKNYKNEKIMSELDILITYIKGQKHIYTQSYRITKQKINLLVFLSLIISGSLAVISPLLQSILWSGYLYSGLNALLTILTTFLNFWNLQNNLSQYNTGATHYDRLETTLIMTRNQHMLISDLQEKNELIMSKIRNTEIRMLEMKEENQILIPLEIQLQAPIISHVDIFTMIQKIEQNTKRLLLEYKDTKNEIRYIMYKWKTRDIEFSDDVVLSTITARRNKQNLLASINEIETTKQSNSYFLDFQVMDPSTRKEQERNRLHTLFQQKESLKHEILNQYKKYAKIDTIFSREIQNAENILYFFSCSFFRREANVEAVLQEFMVSYY